MPFLNSGSSIYHGIQGFYWRRSDYSLISTSGNRAAEIQISWAQIGKQLARAPATETFSLPSRKHVNTFELYLNFLGEPSTFRIRELHDPEHHDRILGLLCRNSPGATQDSGRLSLSTWAELFVLCETRLLHPHECNPEDDDVQLVRRIADVFDQNLRNIAPNDKWKIGRGYFEARVLDYVSRREPIRFCLPAFPCKSPSTEKTCGAGPDRAEYLALKALDNFARHVGDIYGPGAIVLIVSDGHVFSDLLEVKDDQVDTYGESLKQMYYRMNSSKRCNGNIQFTSLTEIFFGNQEITDLFQEQWIEGLDLTHPIESERSENAELCRKLMMALGQNDKTALRSLISSQDPSTLGLYRGLSRFMLDDLAQSRAFAGLSVSKRKRLSTSVAAEMIVRNCAYSNLVELLFPSHVRLSIHAHDNSGPKFAIRLLGPSTAIAIEDLESRNAQKSLDNYHTPTPWHNCLAYVEGERVPYLVKARAAHDAITKGYLQGSWTDSETGGHFVLRPRPLKVEIPQLPAAPRGEVFVSAVEKPQPMLVQQYPMLERMLPLVYLPVKWAVDCLLRVGYVCKTWVSA